MSAFIDPFGAPEFFVGGVAYREIVYGDLMRSTFFASDHGEHIIKVKLIIPMVACNMEHVALQDFIARYAKQRMVS